VHGRQDALHPGHVAHALDRVLARVGEAPEQFLRIGHAKDSSRYGWMVTGVPAGTASNRLRNALLRTRMQPLDSAPPIDHGSFVPWIAIGPPCTQCFSTGEKAETPSAPIPNGPVGSSA